MALFESSGNWIIALGKTLVFSLLIGFLILSVLKVLLQFVSGKHSGKRYWMAVFSLMIYSVSVGLMFFSFYSPVTVFSNEAKTAVSEILSGGMLQNLAVNDQRSTLVILYMSSTYLYFCGILVMLIRLLISIRSIRGLKTTGTIVEGDWAQRFIQLKYMVGVRQKVDLLLSDRIRVPGLIGVFKPAIIIPASMLTHLPVGQVETILLHELYHLKRLDYLMNSVQLFLEVLFFYNPAVWIISQQIRIEREKCCDDGVVEKTSRPEDYANALYQVAQQHQVISSLSTSAAGTNQYHLLNRIKRILNQSTMKSNIREKLSALLLMAGGFVLLFTLSGFSQGFSIIQNDYISQEVAQDSEETKDSQRDSNVVPLETITRASGILEEKQAMSATEIVEIPEPPETILAPDTVPDIRSVEREKAMQEAMDEIDWEEIKKEIETAKQQALEEIDWEEIKRDVETARKEALEEIDWDEIKKEMENSRIHLDSVMKHIDFDFDFDSDEDFDFDFDFEHEFNIDLDQLKLDLEKAMEEIKNIDYEQMKADIKKSLDEIETIDVDKIREDIEKAMEKE